MWLYNRDWTLGRCESEYQSATQSAFKEALEAAFDADTLSDDEAEQLKCAVANDRPHEVAAVLRDLFTEGHLRQEAFDERVREDADSAVTYTADAQLMILMTNNESAYEDEIGDKPESVEAQAAFAYAIDVREWLDNDYTMTEVAEAMVKRLTKESA